MVPRRALDVFELRALGAAAATGEIVAMTEDHCVPAADYLAAMLAAHERHPQLAVAGAVVNGTTDGSINRVNFLLVHARNVPPRDSLPGSGWIPTPSNISYKRRCLPAERPPDHVAVRLGMPGRLADEPARGCDLALSAPARGEPCRLVPVG